MVLARRIEDDRLRLQDALDAVKTQSERNKLGQFATPTSLAVDILEYARTILPEYPSVRFLDPAIGTGSFYSALLNVVPAEEIQSAEGYEIDPHYGEAARKFWSETKLKLHLADFTLAKPPPSDAEKANLIICNPPYVRHHHIVNGEKQRLLLATQLITGLRLNGLAGLYCYFLFLCHTWMAENGIAGWLIPSEFMDVKYGDKVKEYLLSRVTLLRIHRFDPNYVQFDDALVSSAVVWFRKAPPPPHHTVEFTYGGTLLEAAVSRNVSVSTLRHTGKWTRYPVLPDMMRPTASTPKLSDLFTIKRGLATGANKYFILTPKQIAAHNLPHEFFTPILPSPRHLDVNEIEADDQGNPILAQKLFLLTCKLPEHELQANYPALWAYLQQGITSGVNDGYLCRHRTLWYAQENRPAAPFVCTYMSRQAGGNNRPFRFILNHSRATAPNVYLMLYPKPPLAYALRENAALQKAVWNALNEISPAVLLGEGRVYGGGLHKIEPNELGNAPAAKILEIQPGLLAERVNEARGSENAAYHQTRLF